MIGQNIFFGHRSFLVLIACLVFCTSAFAVSEKNTFLVKEKLSEKLREDLADNKLVVEVNNLEEQIVSNSEVEFTGSATAVLVGKDDQLPLQFAVKLDSVNRKVTDIKYNFVEDNPNYAPSANEEILMKELMKQIRQDYKTENIVIAIDSVEKVENANNESKFLGVGEVRIGDLVWNSIKFDVVLNAQTQKANKIVYKVEK